ncbi:hypothetical protein ABPG77_006695 [Micractinium sp. CCAP 211/92]
MQKLDQQANNTLAEAPASASARPLQKPAAALPTQASTANCLLLPGALIPPAQLIVMHPLSFRLPVYCSKSLSTSTCVSDPAIGCRHLAQMHKQPCPLAVQCAIQPAVTARATQLHLTRSPSPLCPVLTSQAVKPPLLHAKWQGSTSAERRAADCTVTCHAVPSMRLLLWLVV